MKTVPNNQSVKAFLDAIENDEKRKDCWTIYRIMKEALGEDGGMWGDSIIGFGTQELKYESGRVLDWFKIGFSPRKQKISLYFLKAFEEYEDLLPQLGKYKTGKSCLYINKLKDIDAEILAQLIQKTISDV